ncbi:MAG: hypothetical protein AB1758_07525 [Candidatus Eremiobacterota bacterium]
MKRNLSFVALFLMLTTAMATAGPRYAVGDRVMIRYGEQWYPATVMGVRADTVFRVRYDGGGGDWNTTLTYMKPEAGGWTGPEPRVGERIRTGFQGVTYAGQIIEKRPGWIYRIKADGVAAEFETLSDYMYLVGRSWWSERDAVMVLWNGTWYKAYIVRVVGPDSFLIHYDGYGSEHDEVVSSSRIAPLSILD